MIEMDIEFADAHEKFAGSGILGMLARLKLWAFSTSRRAGLKLHLFSLRQEEAATPAPGPWRFRLRYYFTVPSVAIAITTDINPPVVPVGFAVYDPINGSKSLSVTPSTGSRTTPVWVIPHSRALEINSLSTAILLPVLIASGWLSDRIGRKPLMLLASLRGLIGALP